MDRRTAIKRTSVIMGAALSSGTMAGLMSGCKAEKQINWKPIFFTPDEAKSISALTETILPKTETPGASEVGVPEFIDDLIGNFWTEADQAAFKSKLADVNQMTEDKFGDSFFNISIDQQNQIMDQLVEQAANHSDPGKPFFREIKELTYSGYFSSEIIGEQVMAYDPVPGTYIGDLPIEEVDKAWSL